MARIGVFALNMSRRTGGVHALIHWLMHHAAASHHRYLFITQRDAQRPPLPPNVTLVARPAAARLAVQVALGTPGPWRIFRRRRSARAALAALCGISPNTLDSVDGWLWPHGFMAIPNLPRTAVICHDMIHHHHPELFDRLALARRAEAERFLGRCHAILCPSSATADDLRRVYPQLATPIHRFFESGGEVPPPGQCAAEMRQLEQRFDGRAIFLYVGVDWPHKNHPLLLEAAQIMRAQRPADQRRWAIVFVGHRRGGTLADEIRRRGLDAQVFDAGSVPRPLLAAYYHRATALVFPSLYEGFGIPLVEAMQCGLPILASDTSCIPEVCGQGALLLAPTQPQLWARQMFGLLDNPQRRGDLATAAWQRGVSFNWPATWRQIDRALDSVISRSPGESTPGAWGLSLSGEPVEHLQLGPDPGPDHEARPSIVQASAAAPTITTRVVIRVEEAAVQKKLTITVDERVYNGLHNVIGPRRISRFIESLVRPYVLGKDLEVAYEQMAQDEAREAEALEWAEATLGDVADETR